MKKKYLAILIALSFTTSGVCFYIPDINSILLRICLLYIFSFLGFLLLNTYVKNKEKE
jgi:hypothetical protein